MNKIEIVPTLATRKKMNKTLLIFIEILIVISISFLHRINCNLLTLSNSSVEKLHSMGIKRDSINLIDFNTTYDLYESISIKVYQTSRIEIQFYDVRRQ